jgi:ferredoxin
MRVSVDTELCHANGLCIQVAPGVFVLEDDHEVVHVVSDQVDEAERERVEEAVLLCPLRALSVES